MLSNIMYLSSTMNRTTRSSTVLCLISVSFFLILQSLKILYASPDTGGNISGSGDAAYKWDLVKYLIGGVGQHFDSTSHHSLRWASWSMAYFLHFLFGESLVVYSLATIIPATISGVLFVWILCRYVHFFVAVLFTLLWMIDPQLYTATFMLTPTGTSLLPLSVLLLFLFHISDKAQLSFLHVLTLSIICFWLYGVKETNLFFVPGVFFLIVRQAGLQTGFLFLILGCFFYAIESLLFWQLGALDHMMGRMYELVLGSAKHIGIMAGDRVDSELKGFYDQGISSRYYSRVNQYHSLIYFVSAYIAAFNIFNYKRQVEASLKSVNELMLYASVMYFSFFILTGFFIIGIEPITLGQPLRARYLAVMLPLGFVLILCGFNSIIQHSARYMLLPFMLISWFVLSIPINWAYSQYSTKNFDLLAMDEHYDSFASALESTDCVISNQKHVLEQTRRWVSGVNASPAVRSFYRAKTVKYKKRYYAKKLSPNCVNVIELKGQYFVVKPSN